MAWVEPGIAGTGTWAPRPDALVNADLAEAAAALAEIVREVRPQVVVTYDPDGGYGHPDHVKAHEITTAAVDLVDSTMVSWKRSTGSARRAPGPSASARP